MMSTPQTRMISDLLNRSENFSRTTTGAVFWQDTEDNGRTYEIGLHHE